MVKITGCILVVMDDFKNVLLLKLKTKRGQEEKWSLISRKLKGKEDCEKCIEKALKTSIKTLIFDLNKVKEVAINDEENYMLYVGNIKEKPMLDKAYSDYKWINKNTLSEYNVEEFEKNILEEIL